MQRDWIAGDKWRSPIRINKQVRRVLRMDGYGLVTACSILPTENKRNGGDEPAVLNTEDSVTLVFLVHRISSN